MVRSICLLLLVLSLPAVVSCGPQPSLVQVPQEPTRSPRPPTVPPSRYIVPTPPYEPSPYPYPALWPTATPRPLPTVDIVSAHDLSEVWNRMLTPTVPPAPPVSVLGTTIAPPEEWESYVSTTVVVAPVGEGPGEVGYQPHGEELPTVADQFTVDVHGNIYILDRGNQRVVQFDPQGRFIQNIPYADVWYPELLAADTERRIYLYDAGLNPQEASVKCYDREGHLVQKFLVPPWFFMDRRILAMRVDEQGTLWVEGNGYAPDAPIIDGQPYPRVAVPLGGLGQTFDGQQQKEKAIPGWLLPSGQTAIFSFWHDTAYLYDRYGRSIYAYRQAEQLLDIDQLGNLFTVEGMSYATSSGAPGFHRVRKYTAGGVMVASFDIPMSADEYPDFLACEGVVYTFTFNRATHDRYRVVRWERE